VPRVVLLACCLLALAVAGCGERRAARPDVTTTQPPAAPQGRTFPAAGVRFEAPQNWRLQAGAAPLVATLASGQAIVAVWRYPRTEIPPATKAALRQARKRLIGQARKRDGRLRVVASRLSRVDHAPAIVLVGQEVIRGQVRVVRSTHVFAHQAEVVVDAYAPPASFPAVNQSVLGPLVASLKLQKPRTA
jgi:hypothetical protein